MAKYHINPETQRPNLCRAVLQCAYASNGETPPHFDSKEDARAYVEQSSKEEYTGQKIGGLSKENSLITKLTHQDPKNFDEDLSKIYSDKHDKMYYLNMYHNMITKGYDRFNNKYYYKYGKNGEKKEPKSFETLLKEAKNSSRSKDVYNYNNYVKIAKEVKELDNKIDTYNNVFVKRGGWTRAFIVPDGHVHSNTECSTCHKGKQRTRFSWLPQYSNNSEEDIVRDAGYRACTVCYPSAPVGDSKSLPTKIFTDEEKAKIQEQAEREQKKKDKESERISKAPTITGEPLRIDLRTEEEKASGERTWGFETFKTERSASIWYVDYIKYNDKAYKEARDKILYNLALKKDVSIKELKEELDNKALAKEKKKEKSDKKMYDSGQAPVWLGEYNPKNYVIELDSNDIPDKYYNTSPRNWDENGRLYIP